MHSVLARIVDAKKTRLAARRAEMPVSRLNEMLRSHRERRDFHGALAAKDRINIIAEVKRASPSAGMIAGDFDPGAIARRYAEGGAAAVSVLTEEDHFRGELSYLATVRRNAMLPVLRKDFVFDEYQVLEAAAFGADALLLIADILDRVQLNDLLAAAEASGLDVLVEVHDERDMEKALACPVRMLGINNRDLETFEVDLSTAVRLGKQVPRGIVTVVESGIRTPGDVSRYLCDGMNSFLIGEALMRSGDPAEALRELTGAMND